MDDLVSSSTKLASLMELESSTAIPTERGPDSSRNLTTGATGSADPSQPTDTPAHQTRSSNAAKFPSTQDAGLAGRLSTGSIQRTDSPPTKKRSVSFDLGVTLHRQSTLAVLLDKYRKRRDAADDSDPAFLAGAKKVILFLHSLWIDQTMCDLLFTTDGGEVLAHQVVVAAYSPTLARLLREKQKNSVQQTAQIDLKDFPREIVVEIINFLYTTDIELDCRTIGQIVACARNLDLPIIRCICQDYLIDNCDRDNIILHYSIADNNSLTEIGDRLLRVICQGFSDIYKTKHFVVLPYDRLIAILTHPDLCCPEIDVFLAIVRWIDNCRPQRIQFAKPLLEMVRYQLIEPGQLATHVQPVEWIFVDKECLDQVLEAYKFHALNSTRSCALRTMEIQPERCCSSRSRRKSPSPARSSTSRRQYR